MKDLTILEISSFMPASVDVFESFNIDYYRKGYRTLEDACRDCNVDIVCVSDTIAELELSGAHEVIDVNHFDLCLKELISRIRNKFHAGETVQLRKLESKFAQIAEAHPNLELARSIQMEFKELAADFIFHAIHEEENLFPYIIRLYEADEHNDPSLLRTLFHTDMILYEEEHDDSTQKIGHVRSSLCILQSVYPDEKLISATLEDLDRFIRELHLHLHFENNIVFPKAKNLEARLRARLRNTA